MPGKGAQGSRALLFHPRQRNALDVPRRGSQLTAEAHELLGDLAVLAARIETAERRILEAAELRLSSLHGDPTQSAEVELLTAVIARSKAMLPDN